MGIMAADSGFDVELVWVVRSSDFQKNLYSCTEVVSNLLRDRVLLFWIWRERGG
jgi:hypothetical protein